MVVVKLNGFLFARGGLATKQNKGARTTDGGLFVSDVARPRSKKSPVWNPVMKIGKSSIE